MTLYGVMDYDNYLVHTNLSFEYGDDYMSLTFILPNYLPT